MGIALRVVLIACVEGELKEFQAFKSLSLIFNLWLSSRLVFSRSV